MRATMAAERPYCTAVALTELPAAFVSFQRQLEALPPHKNVNSAVSPSPAAVQFSGNITNNATNVVTTAAFATF